MIVWRTPVRYRHLADRGNQPTLISDSTETGVERSYSFNAARRHAALAATLIELGVRKAIESSSTYRFPRPICVCVTTAVAAQTVGSVAP